MINNTRIKWTLNKSSYKAKKDLPSLFVWFLEYQGPSCSSARQKSLYFKLSELRKFSASFGSCFQWLVIGFAWKGTPPGWRCVFKSMYLSVLECWTRLRLQNGNELGLGQNMEMRRWTQAYGKTGQGELQQMWKTRYLSNLHFQLWTVNQAAQLQHKLGMRKMRLGAWLCKTAPSTRELWNGAQPCLGLCSAVALTVGFVPQPADFGLNNWEQQTPNMVNLRLRNESLVIPVRLCNSKASFLAYHVECFAFLNVHGTTGQIAGCVPFSMRFSTMIYFVQLVLCFVLLLQS